MTVMRAFYKAEDYLDHAAQSATRPIVRRALGDLGRLIGRIGDVLRSMAL